MSKLDVLGYAEVKTNIHRVNERLRYYGTKYGTDNAVYQSLVHETKRLLAGTGLALEQRKGGTVGINESENVINAIISKNLSKNQSQRWRQNTKNINPKEQLKKLENKYGKVKGGKMEQKIKSITDKKKRADMVSRVIDNMLDNGIIGSDEVNTICRDRITAKKLIDDYMKNKPNFNPDSNADLLELAEMLYSETENLHQLGVNVSHKYFNIASAETANEFTGFNSRGKKKKFVPSTSTNPFTDTGKIINGTRWKQF